MFDIPEVSAGLGLIRTLVWFKDYAEVYSPKALDMNAVVVLRHNAIWKITVLACNLAFNKVVEQEKGEAGGDAAKAREMALHHVVPGVILQPSGVFGVLRAQEAGCHYILAS